MSELKPCPFCGKQPAAQCSSAICINDDCELSDYWRGLEDDSWNTRPIEDALTARIAELEAECASLGVRLHDEMSQLEIATDLGNKRWLALNDIYENGEKHNTNWCKRIAQEGLGIK